MRCTHLTQQLQMRLSKTICTLVVQRAQQQVQLIVLYRMGVIVIAPTITSAVELGPPALSVALITSMSCVVA